MNKKYNIDGPPFWVDQLHQLIQENEIDKALLLIFKMVRAMKTNHEYDKLSNEIQYINLHELPNSCLIALIRAASSGYHNLQCWNSLYNGIVSILNFRSIDTSVVFRGLHNLKNLN